jgi:hypothetical protein
VMQLVRIADQAPTRPRPRQSSRSRGRCLYCLASLRMVVGQGAGCGVPAFRAFMTKCSQSP